MLNRRVFVFGEGRGVLWKHRLEAKERSAGTPSVAPGEDVFRSGVPRPGAGLGLVSIENAATGPVSAGGVRLRRISLSTAQACSPEKTWRTCAKAHTKFYLTC